MADGEYWRLVTAGFLHAGLFHLLFNMFALYRILGPLLEPAIGQVLRADLLRVGAGGLFGALIVDPNSLTVGASGGIFGLWAPR